MSRKRDNWTEVLIEIAAMLPWWAGLLLAFASYVLLHWLAAPEPASTAKVLGPQMLGNAVFRGFATVGQFLLPVFFGIGAAVSAFRSVQQRRNSRSVDFENGQPLSETKSGGTSTSTTMDPDRYPEWKAAGAQAPVLAPIREDQWSLELLKRLEWKRFEYVCSGYFEELGFRAETVGAGPDGGVDIRLYEKGSREARIIVQCKAWQDKPVGVKEVRELFGVMAADGVEEGIFATTSTFSADARSFARGKSLHLIDGEDLLAKLQALSPERQKSLVEFATDGDYTTPTCPSCGTKMVLRESRAEGNPFWGCSSFPRCRAVLKVSRRG